MADESTWPPYLVAGRSTLREVVDGLVASQGWSADELRSGQARQLAWLLDRAVRTVPWYGRASWARDVLAAAGQGEEAFWSAWARIPLLGKAELRAHPAELKARSVAAVQKPVATISTSGSTGIPVEIQSTSASRLVWDALTVREHLWRERDPSRRLGVIRYLDKSDRSPAGSRQARWGSPVAQLGPTGPSAAIHIGLPIADLAEWLHRFDPHYLLTHPSVAAGLLDALPGRSGRPPSLEEVRCISEPMDPTLEQRLREEWGVEVSDIYSANEVGYMAFRCRQGGLHVQSESVLVEILDEAGRPCAPGETGRVVVTGLHNVASPLFRYEIGDLATVGTPCGCGRALPVIDRVMGRVRNLVRTPDGRSFWPAGLPAIRSITPIRQFQFVQTALDALELRLVLDRPLTAEESGRAVQKVRDLLGHPFHVAIVPMDSIPRGPTGKYEEFQSQLPA